jgi:hypothetical protein
LAGEEHFDVGATDIHDEDSEGILVARGSGHGFSPERMERKDNVSRDNPSIMKPKTPRKRVLCRLPVVCYNRELGFAKSEKQEEKWHRSVNSAGKARNSATSSATQTTRVGGGGIQT